MTDAAAKHDHASGPPPTALLKACRAAHERLSGHLESVDDVVVKRPSRLPNWTIGHVLTHLARNADSFVRILEAGGEGHEVEQYPGGPAQREGEIETGATRTSASIVNDFRSSARRLDDAFRAAADVEWQLPDLCRDLPSRRLREVELHHVDLGLGYEPADWPDDVLDVLLSDVARRLPTLITTSAGRAAFVAWATGRASSLGAIELGRF